MNDFTKEEFKSLRWGIEYVRERTNNRGDAMRGLLTKIQSLIDNYCEHENELDSKILLLINKHRKPKETE